MLKSNQDALKKDQDALKNEKENKEDYKVLIEMIKQLLKLSEAHQKDHDANVKLNSEQLKNENENNQLKKELMIAQEVNQRIPKMEEEVIGLNSEVLALKQHRQTDQITINCIQISTFPWQIAKTYNLVNDVVQIESFNPLTSCSIFGILNWTS